MRLLLPLVLLAALAGGIVRFARADDGNKLTPEAMSLRIDTLTQRVEALEHQNAYLLAREARLTAALLKNADRGDGLKRLVVELREGGFAAAANPSPTRERMLQGLDALAESLKKEVPSVTKEEVALLPPTR